MTTQNILQAVINQVSVSSRNMVDASTQDRDFYFATPVFIHHDSDQGGTVASFMFKGHTYRFQIVDGEVYGDFGDKDWSDIKADYISTGFDWAEPVMYEEDFAALPAEKTIVSPSNRAVFKLANGVWFAKKDKVVTVVSDVVLAENEKSIMSAKW